MRDKIIAIIFLISMLYSCADLQQKSNYLSQNTLKNFSYQNIFTDNGSWFGFGLDYQNDSVGFKGPFLKSNNEWFAKNLLNLKLFENNKLIQFEKIKNSKFNLPGKIVVENESEFFQLKRELIFTSANTALIKQTLINKRKTAAEYLLIWYGNIDSNFFNISNSEKRIQIEKQGDHLSLIFPSDISYKFNIYKDSYSVSTKSVYLEAESSRTDFLEIEFYTKYEIKNPFSHAPEVEKHKYFELNEVIWKDYYTSILNSINPQYDSSRLKKLAIDCTNLLISNLKNSIGDISGNSFLNSQNFVRTEDTWLVAPAVGFINPNKAKDLISSVFKNQDSFGHLESEIYIDSSKNQQNPILPLSAWSTLYVFKQSNDLVFLEELFPKLIKHYNAYINEIANPKIPDSYKVLLKNEEKCLREIASIIGEDASVIHSFKIEYLNDNIMVTKPDLDTLSFSILAGLDYLISKKPILDIKEFDIQSLFDESKKPDSLNFLTNIALLVSGLNNNGNFKLAEKVSRDTLNEISQLQTSIITTDSNPDIRVLASILLLLCG